MYMSDALLLEAKRITKSYISKDDRVEVLRGCSLTVRQRDFILILGPSGSGKSTLLNLLAGIDTPDSGAIHFQGADIARLDDTARTRLRRSKIGLIFQGFELLPLLTVYENIHIPLVLNGVPRSERQGRIERIADALGIHKELRRRINYISGGQRQRVAIARTLVVEPTLILGDEITGGVDTATSPTCLF